MKLKLNKKIGLFMGIGILVVVLAGMGMVSYQKLGEKTNLETQLTTSQARLQNIKPESLPSPPVDLEKQLGLLTPEIETTKAKLSQPVSSANATAAVFDAAKSNNLVITKITSSSPTNQSVAGITLSAMSMTASVNGKVTKIVNFVASLNNLLKISAITSVEITVPEIINADNTTVNDTDNATANIDLVVYTYRGE